MSYGISFGILGLIMECELKELQEIGYAPSDELIPHQDRKRIHRRALQGICHVVGVQK
jgi:hypothetical protein